MGTPLPNDFMLRILEMEDIVTLQNKLAFYCTTYLFTTITILPT